MSLCIACLAVPRLVSEIEVAKALTMDLRMADLAARQGGRSGRVRSCFAVLADRFLLRPTGAYGLLRCTLVPAVSRPQHMLAG
jgi:hypothetical protein